VNQVSATTLEQRIKGAARSLGLAAGLVASTIGFTTKAGADQVIPVVAAAPGLYDSQWASDAKLHNPHAETIYGDLVFTPRGESKNGNSVRIPFSLGPNETLFEEDVYSLAYGDPGAARVDVEMATDPDTQQPYPDPIVDAAIYNDTGDGEFGQSPTIYHDEELETANGTYRMTIGKLGERTNLGITTGSQGATITWTAYGPAGNKNGSSITNTYSANAFHQHYGNPDGVTVLLGSQVENTTLEARIDEGSAIVSLSTNNNETNDSRWKDFEETETPIPPGDQAALYVNKWLPQGRFYLNGDELSAMVNGGRGTRSYASDLATELWNDPNVQANFADTAAVEQWLRDRADGNPDNSEFCADFDPIQWTEGVGLRTYGGATCGPVDFTPGEEAMARIYTLIKGINQVGERIDGFLVTYVENNADLYGGELGGTPDMAHNPTWNTQDPN